MAVNEKSAFQGIATYYNLCSPDEAQRPVIVEVLKRYTTENHTHYDQSKEPTPLLVEVASSVATAVVAGAATQAINSMLPRSPYRVITTATLTSFPIPSRYSPLNLKAHEAELARIKQCKNALDLSDSTKCEIIDEHEKVVEANCVLGQGYYKSGALLTAGTILGLAHQSRLLQNNPIAQTALKIVALSSLASSFAVFCKTKLTANDNTLAEHRTTPIRQYAYPEFYAQRGSQPMHQLYVPQSVQS